MSVNIHGKEYRTVSERINLFYELYGKYGTAIGTEIIKDDGKIVQVKATVSVQRAPENQLFGTGYAEEDRSKGRINSTSALENCETSAIGRALASIGLGGEEYASANEVENARFQQEQPSNKVVSNDDGSFHPPVQKNEPGLLNGTVDQAKQKMSNDNNTNGGIKDGVCNFKKYKGVQWSRVAMIDEDGENGLEYMQWVKDNVENLDANTSEIISQYIG